MHHTRTRMISSMKALKSDRKIRPEPNPETARHTNVGWRNLRVTEASPRLAVYSTIAHLLFSPRITLWTGFCLFKTKIFSTILDDIWMNKQKNMQKTDTIVMHKKPCCQSCFMLLQAAANQMQPRKQTSQSGWTGRGWRPVKALPYWYRAWKPGALPEKSVRNFTHNKLLSDFTL